MKFQLFHQDSSGKISNSIMHISFLAFIKHITFAGIGPYNLARHPFRFHSLFYEFFPPIFGTENFNVSPYLSKDPTEKAYLSNKIGRTFADFLAKKIYAAKFTHCYESVMYLKKIPIHGKRPDFYCDTMTQQFAIEAKGYTRNTISDIEMNEHKIQSSTGPIPTNFSVASVAFDLYKQPKIKFYDPENESDIYDTNLNSMLIKFHYDSVLKFINLTCKTRKENAFKSYLAFDIPLNMHKSYQFLIHKNILKPMNNLEWLNDIEYKDNDEFYIDSDGIGLYSK